MSLSKKKGQKYEGEMMSQFKYCKDENKTKFIADQEEEDWDDGLAQANSLREIAYQLKRIDYNKIQSEKVVSKGDKDVKK